jgi:transcription initiation factor TFIIIB Brf1 subunit/transcription initiation factor TFIIB
MSLVRPPVYDDFTTPSQEEEYADAEEYAEECDASLLEEIFSDDESPQIDNKFECCLHANIIKEGNVEKCADCGLEMYLEISLEPEWRFYDNGDGSLDPARCHIRKEENRNIYSDLKGCGLSKEIMQEANKLYYMITSGKIRRAALRKAIIYACIFNAFKQLEETSMPDDLEEKFGLDKKAITRGLKHFHMSMEKKLKPSYISPSIFIKKVMNKFKAGNVHVQRIEKLYDLIQNKSVIVKRCNPQSVICGLVFYYWKLLSITNSNYNINCAKYSSMVGLSEITVQKLAKEISKLLGTCDLVKLT